MSLEQVKLETSNLVYGLRIDLNKSHLMDDKISPKVAWSGSRADFFLNFGTYSIYLDRVEQDISNLTNSCNVARTRRQMRN